MSEDLGYGVTPKQSLDGLWITMNKHIERHGYSDISFEIEGSCYEFREHLQKYGEYEAKAEVFDEIKSIHLNMFGATVRPITLEEAENFGMSVMRALKIGEDE